MGSGYSNIWIEGDVGVTMHTADEVDVVTAFRVADGEEIWRYELGPKYAGHDGSDDHEPRGLRADRRDDRRCTRARGPC